MIGARPVRIRFDDSVILSSDPKIKGRELQKWKKNIEWCLPIANEVRLTPAVLCQDIEEVEGAVEQLRIWTEEGKVSPELHGWDHGPYGTRPQQEIEEHLEQALEWFEKKLGVVPYRWVTPHGANSRAMQYAAEKFCLVIETTNSPVVDQKQMDTYLRDSYDLAVLKGKVIMNHWWNRGLQLYRIARIIEHQNIRRAICATRSELSEADHKICWNGWMRI